MIKVKRVLISVSDKKGIVAFAQGLNALGVEIVSTGGTAQQLRESGLSVIEVGDYTGFPEMLDGRVKTLHPKIHGGLLALRDKEEHMAQIAKHGIGLIDMVVVNLYPFESVTKKKNVTLNEAIENIDIGGPSMLRSAAKNYRSVAVLCNPARYDEILGELKQNTGILPDRVLFGLSVEAFRHTARYDSIIAEYLSRKLQADDLMGLPRDYLPQYTKLQDLRYGENPHQKAAFFREAGDETGLARMRQLHGKELSFNNILDLNAAVDFLSGLPQPAAVVIKHNNPTGVAMDSFLCKAFKAAWKADPISAFGGIIGLNRVVDEATAQGISKAGFVECVIAPGYDPRGLEILTQKKNIRLLELDLALVKQGGYDFKRVHGGLLLQERDERVLSENELQVVSKKKPTEFQIKAMLFGWSLVKHVKSNAIVLVKGTQTIGIGCGQTSRVESVKIAIEKAGKSARGAVLVSDAFIPKIDNITLAVKAGIKAVIQTGGSIEDENVIKAADKAGLVMVMTGVRHFKH
ncbi:MAG: bifunctional phosphoribosylaminoimidazolecarboxamide formyltransferase/IMP cyclohydrolase [Candidatus Omnitrophica bacterium]|nr:bifunctional phosphoribosylaminoimidazolecarboxamide formyltransferase/IMP cyclohydrolase [Candidatus Omnitrophota bacterium]